ncbi:hypothetical protein a10_07655 [Streptomyces acidiscabies]|nr:hypothetical protein a10_07655 [Streptomyces acidiscabies]GAV42220.1 hypothetical protein Saa2_05142 [Streptomyces acidiscabies]
MEGCKWTLIQSLFERLHDCASGYLDSLTNRNEPFANSFAGNVLRSVEAGDKISGCHQFERGAAVWLSMHFFLSFARKYGLRSCGALRSSFTCNLGFLLLDFLLD